LKLLKEIKNWFAKKAIRDKVFPVKIGKFSVEYYTFEELQ